MSTGSYTRSIASSLPGRVGLRPVQRSQAALTVHSFMTYLCLFLISGLTVLTLTVLMIGAALYPDGYPDPFTPYEAIVPDGPFVLVTEQYPCHRQLLASIDHESALNALSEQSSCAITPNSEHFSKIVVISQAESVHEVRFLIARMQAVDLFHRWGPPDLIQQSWDGYSLTWNVGVIARVPADRRFSYLLPVRTVLLRSVI
jgi:hypothetical protein